MRDPNNESGVYKAYRDPGQVQVILVSMGILMGFVLVLWVLLEWNYTK